MRKLTIAQQRERELQRLVGYKTSNPSASDINEARRLMNSLYRLCGLCEKNLWLENTERTCNLKSTQASEERERRWWQRLDKDFKEIYGLRLVYCGYMPSVVKECEHGGVSNAVSLFFYE